MAPLKEVIFELHWSGSTDNSGAPVDDGFDLAQGKLAEKLKSTYPVHKKLYPDGMPIRVFGAPMHQYWKGEFQWPVIQHGCGMLAVNEVESGYEWERTYKPTVLNAIEMLISSYEDPIKFNKAKLQYVDAWDVSGEEAAAFIEFNLRTAIKSSYPMVGKQKSFNLIQTFELEDGSEMQLTIATGTNNQNQQPAVIWTTTIEKKDIFKQEEITLWLELAHTTASEMFKNMLNPDFYASLDR